MSGRGRTNRNIAVSVLLKAAALVVLSVLTAFCLAGKTFAVDLTEPNSLTVNIQDGFRDDEGLKDEDLIVEMYKIADARNDIEPAKGYDTYTLVTTEAFADLQSAIDGAQIAGTEAKTQWDQISQQAVKLVRSGKGGTPAATGHTGEQIDDLSAGLYLVITHGTEEPYYYDDEGKGPVLTTALSEKYEYYFSPQLIAFPYVLSGEEQGETFNTGDANGEWANDLTIVLKGDRKDHSEPESDVPPDEKPETGDRSGLHTQKLFFFVSGVMILLLAAAMAVMRKRD